MNFMFISYVHAHNSERKEIFGGTKNCLKSDLFETDLCTCTHSRTDLTFIFKGENVGTVF